MGELPGLGGGPPGPIGSLVDTFCGISAYENGPVPGNVHHWGAFGPEFQCTEFAYRFTCQYFDMCDLPVQYGDAKTWYTNLSSPLLKQLTRYDNGGTEPPRPGDIIVWDGYWGHVAIVKSVSDTEVSVIEQNMYDGSHIYPIDTNGGTYTMPSVFGWMRAPGGPVQCEGGDGEGCGCEGSFDVANVNGNELFVSGSIECDATIEKFSVVVHETTVYSGFPEQGAISFAETIQLAPYELGVGSAAVGLWVRPQGHDACLVDDTDVVLEGDGVCVDNGATQCVGNDVYIVDSCGDPVALDEACGDTTCVNLSPTSASCMETPTGCDGVGIDPGEECDGIHLGGATCQSEGFDSGTIACSPVCTLDTSACCNDQAYSQCQGGNVHWFDSCDGLGAIKETCGGGETCVNTSPTTAICSEDCGNGQVDFGEDCDGGVGGVSCEDLGYDGGVLDCTNSCTYDESSCESCNASAYWSPSSKSQTDSTGLQNDDIIDVPIRIDIEEDGQGLRFRVCKEGDTFMNDVKVSVLDAGGGGASKLVPTLSTTNNSCSPWTSMSNDDGYSEGEVFNGAWNMVSPHEVANHWPLTGQCVVEGNPWGTCWSGSGLTLTRTCKE